LLRARHPTGDTMRCISGNPHAFARRKMPIGTRELYRSLDGDRWPLCGNRNANRAAAHQLM
jgi:hypothetical protein